MCGILGYLSKGSSSFQPDRSRFEEAVQMMFHRGPDAAGTWFGEKAALGFRRLSVIDLASGNQPMTSEDGRCHIVFNGEIYNYQELRGQLEAKGRRFRTRSDTEVILQLYQEMGPTCVKKLRGMFAFAVLDSKDETIFLARDRFGKKPLIYAETSHAFYFASEIKPLLHIADVKRVINLEAVQAYLAFRYVPADQTFWRDCKRLPHASTMWVEKGCVKKVDTYWQLPRPVPTHWSEEESIDRLRSGFEESVKARLVSDVPLGAFLSGGVDSSVTLAAMRKFRSNIDTFSIGFDDEKFDETKYAREAARRAGSTHHELRASADSLDCLDPLIENMGEPFADQSLLVTHVLAKFTRSKVTVALSGDGGDELFSGYKRYRHMDEALRIEGLGLRGARLAGSFLFFKLEQLFNRKRRKLSWPRSVVDKILPMDENERYAYLLSSWHDGLRSRLWTGHGRTFSAADFIQKRHDHLVQSLTFSPWQQLDIDLYLCDDILRKVDVASMAASLECRCPFIDHYFVELIASIPTKWLSHVSNRKNLLRKLYPETFGTDFFNRKKKGFSMPIGDWMKKQWKEIIGQSINQVSTNGMELFIDRKTLNQIWKEHQDGREDHGDRLWTWYVLSKWNEIFKPDWEE